MTDLQISLLIIGVVVVGGVYLFNWIQERKFRRRLGQAFDAGRDDVLFKGPEAGGRVEPQLQRAAEPAAVSLSAADRAKPTESVAAAAPEFGLDTAIDYVAAIDSETPIPESVIDELLSRTAACGKPYRALGLHATAGQWEEMARAAGNRYVKLRLALQLVNRSGSVNAAQLAIFCDAIKHCADRIAAAASCPDPQAALKAARELDRFCATVDIAIGVNIIAVDGAAFPGTKIRALAEAAGFKLEPDGVFHFRNEQRQTLFTLDNHEPAPFLPEQIKGLSTGGVTLLLDVPRVTDGLNVLDRMLDIGHKLAQGLGGRLVDDNRVALNEAGIARIRRQLAEIYATMEARGVSAGGERASRLFS